MSARGAALPLAIALFLLPWRAAAGSVGGAFPDLQPSARIEAMGGLLPASVSGGDAVLGNPAGLLALPDREVRVASMDLFGLGIVRYSAIQLAWPIQSADVEWNRGQIQRSPHRGPATHAFGVAVTHIGTDVPDDSYGETQVALAYGFWLPERFRAGVSYRLLWAQSRLSTSAGYESDLGATGHAIDFGVQRPLGPLHLGLLARNLASTVNWNRGVDGPLDRRWIAGLAITPHRGFILEAHAVWAGDAFRAERQGVGVEWRPVSVIALRAAARGRGDALGRDVEWAGGASFSLWRITADYSYSTHSADLGDTRRWNLGFGF